MNTADDVVYATQDSLPDAPLSTDFSAFGLGSYQALWLTTEHRDTEHALDLAKAEATQTRSDVFIWDALAWTQHAAGQTAAAIMSARRAMAEGTRDARLFLHAGIIALNAGDAQAAARLRKARDMRALLLPAEQIYSRWHEVYGVEPYTV